VRLTQFFGQRFQRFVLRASNTSRHLSAAKHRASSSPIPDDAPVIKTVSPCMFFLFWWGEATDEPLPQSSGELKQARAFAATKPLRRRWRGDRSSFDFDPTGARPTEGELLPTVSLFAAFILPCAGYWFPQPNRLVMGQ